MKRNVALIIETSSRYGRGLLEGIVRFMRTHDDWSVFLEQRDLTRKVPDWLDDWKGDGIISRATTPHLLKVIQATGIPLVDLTDRKTDSALQPHMRSDDSEIGKMAAQHLLDRGFQRFGFCGFEGEAWSARREKAFVAMVQEAGLTCDVYRSPWVGSSVQAWEEEQRQIAGWLTQFPGPFGVMACNDIRGQHVLDACSRKMIAVPEEVAVIGVDNDELLCRVCSPPLSSVIPNAERVGYRAAEILSMRMEGGAEDRQPELIAPLDVATRQSTDVVAIEDKAVADALHYIRQHACRGLSVEDVTRNVVISRSTLERKLRKYLGRTPQEEIRTVQIKKARELLATTDLSTKRVADLCGFEHPEYLHVVFKRLTHMTPGQYRRSANPGDRT